MSRKSSKKESKKLAEELEGLKEMRKRGIIRCVLVFVAVIAVTVIRHILALQGIFPYDNAVVNGVMYVLVLALCFFAGPAAMSISRIGRQIKELEAKSQN